MFFQGRAGDQKVLALSVPKGSDPASLSELAARPDRVVLVYEEPRKVSSVEPLAVFAGSKLAIISEAPERSAVEPTIGDLIQAANVAGPKKLNAVCRDRTRVSASGRSKLTQMAFLWRACSGRGGFERWYQTSTRDPNAIVATICADYRLVAGSGKACGARGRLVRVLNRKYSAD